MVQVGTAPPPPPPQQPNTKELQSNIQAAVGHLQQCELLKELLGYKWSIKLLPSNWLIVIPAVVKTYVVVLATLTVRAFEFINQNHVTSLATPVLDGTRNTQGAHTANITGYEDVPRSNEKALLNWLSNQPVRVCIDVGGEDFMRILKKWSLQGVCGLYIDQCVSAIGQGISDDGQLICHKYIAM
ncbi:hypothetical protein EV1_025180 [Malus domestica]